MRMIALLLGALILLAPASAEAAQHTASYTVGEYLQVTRTATITGQSPCGSAGVTGACGNTGAVAPQSYYPSASTLITLTLKNVGPADRENVRVIESLSHVPSGARLSYSQAPSQADGRSAAWNLGSLKPGEEKSVGYSYSARAEIGQLEKIPQAQASSDPVKLVLSATQEVFAGEKVTLVLKTASGQPVTGAEVRIGLPDGSTKAVKTDSSGRASFAPEKEGFYTYSVEGYGLARLVSTSVAGKVAPPPAAAAAFGSDLVPLLSSFLPAIAAIFSIAVIMLVLYNFVAQRGEDEEPAQAPQQQGATYSQSYSFSAPKKEEGDMLDATRELVESRKRQMQESANQPPAEAALDSDSGLGEQEEAQLRKEIELAEKTSAEEDIEAELSKLAEQAEGEGETSEQEEEEIEKAIAELEAIRAQLREKKERMEEFELRQETAEGGAGRENETQGGTGGLVEEGTEEQYGPSEKEAPGSRGRRVLPPKKKLSPTVKKVRRK